MPKGVATTHRDVVRLVRGSAFASFSPVEVLLQLAPVSFDASTFEVQAVQLVSRVREAFGADISLRIFLLSQNVVELARWSVGVLVREPTTLYRAFASGEPSPLPKLEIQYADYAHWQRSRLQGDPLDQHLAYWRGKLAGASPLLELPTDRPRPPLPSYRGAEYAFTLSPALSGAVRELSRSEGATPFMTLLAAFQTLLHRYTKREDIVAGADVNNRRHLGAAYDLSGRMLASRVRPPRFLIFRTPRGER